MRIRNRPAQPSPFFPFPSDIPPFRKPSLERALVYKPAGLEDADASRRKEEGGAQEADDLREATGGSHQRQIDPRRCFLTQQREGSGSPAHRAFDSMVGEEYLEMDDSSELPLPAPVEKEAWQDRGRSRLSAVEKNGGGRNGKTEGPLDSEPSKGSGSWAEGEKAFPVKKRKRSPGWREEEELLAVGRKTKTKPRGNTGKEQSLEEEKVAEEVDTDRTDRKCRRSSHTSVNRTKAGVLMEGSRCSRINGRGWRCSQQTLVGYSLCEHHLGKGRLKSMSSLRSRHSAVRTPQCDNVNGDTSLLYPAPNDQETLVEAMKGKTRKNIGMVKARSMSSLLGVVAHSSALSANGSVTGAITNASEAGASRIPGQLTNELV